jgi:hypothetical protein
MRIYAAMQQKASTFLHSGNAIAVSTKKPCFIVYYEHNNKRKMLCLEKSTERLP